MKLGKLDLAPATEKPTWMAPPTQKALQHLEQANEIWVAQIDPTFADTAAFCQQYEVSPDQSVNCVIIEARRGENRTYAACMILATQRADVNGVVRRHLDARKASFASMETAVQLSGMEYGGITPIGLPSDWPILIDPAVLAVEQAIIGSGIRASKLMLPGKLLAELPGALVLDGLAQQT